MVVLLRAPEGSEWSKTPLLKNLFYNLVKMLSDMIIEHVTATMAINNCLTQKGFPKIAKIASATPFHKGNKNKY